MPKVSVIHPGTQHAPNLARELNKLHLLLYFITSIGWTPMSLFIRFLKTFNKRLHKTLSNRIFNIEQEKLITYPLSEFFFNINKRHKNQSEIEYYIYKRNERFQSSVSTRFIKKSDVLIGFDTSSWIIARRAKQAGKKFILDQTIGHPLSKHQFYDEIRKKYPLWKDSDVLHKSQKLLELEIFEHSISDAIVVASNFTKETLISNGVLAEKIYINPMGIDQSLFKNLNQRDYKVEKLKFLFVGTINARKGIPDLLQVWEELKPYNAELLLVGTNQIPQIVLNSISDPSIKFLGKIEKNKLPLIYNEAHIFIFPSYFEGFGQVQLEALACGLPVIGSSHSAKELIIDGYNGFIMEPGDLYAMKKFIKYFLDNREKSYEMSKNAANSVVDFSWENYAERWKEIIDKVVSE